MLHVQQVGLFFPVTASVLTRKFFLTARAAHECNIQYAEDLFARKGENVSPNHSDRPYTRKHQLFCFFTSLQIQSPSQTKSLSEVKIRYAFGRKES
jgi:hypothetical protein